MPLIRIKSYQDVVPVRSAQKIPGQRHLSLGLVNRGLQRIERLLPSRRHHVDGLHRVYLRLRKQRGKHPPHPLKLIQRMPALFLATIRYQREMRTRHLHPLIATGPCNGTQRSPNQQNKKYMSEHCGAILSGDFFPARAFQQAAASQATCCITDPLLHFGK